MQRVEILIKGILPNKWLLERYTLYRIGHCPLSAMERKFEK